MRVSARQADEGDIEVITGLYRKLEKEMAALHPMWPVADGLNEPVDQSLKAALSEPASILIIGSIEDYPLGFLLARTDGLLDQAAGEQVGSIRLVFVDREAREVAVAEAMRDLAMDLFRNRGITKFDAHVLPGHRLAKNFFEAGGFSARSIIMHHDDDD